MLKKRFFKTKAEADVTFEFAHNAIGSYTSTDIVEPDTDKVEPDTNKVEPDTNKVEPDTNKVDLMSEFNNWQPIAMKYIKKDNVFRTKVRLPVGQQFHYRYLINNQEWHNDQDADLYQPNEYGSDNSVVSTANKSETINMQTSNS
jgi:1,4-alpha-glucan branching enzyme